MTLRHLTDAALLARLTALAAQERQNVGDIVEHLAEVDRRDLVVDGGYMTLFDYCVKTLRYSEAAAFVRIRAARAGALYPRILADLRSGALHLDAIARLSPHLREDNSDRLLDQAAGATSRAVIAFVSTLDGTGTAPERDVIRRLPLKLAAPPPGEEPFERELPIVAAEEPASAGVSAPPSAQEKVLGLPQPTVIAPLARVRLAFTADDEFLLMVEKLRSLQRHKFPSGRLEELLKDAVAARLAKLDPDLRMGRSPTSDPASKIGHSSPSAAPRRSRRIPAAVKIEVWKRDGGRCAYVASDGRRCEGREFLEYDHITPWALGGGSDSAENIRLLCRPHNQRLAKRRFGPRRRKDRMPVCSNTVEHGQEPGA